MKELMLKAAHDEVLSLLCSGTEEIETRNPQIGVALLIEAQFLLAEIIQRQLNKIDCSPPLSPFVGEWADKDERNVTAVTS